MFTADATTRFSDRVNDYVKYRPTYPADILPKIARVASLGPGAKIADIGSGTGISAAWLLVAEPQYEVFAVEPNPDMRAAAERELVRSPRFHSIAGSADQTNLPDKSIDLVLCAQSFHWFNPITAKQEFSRILKDREGSKYVALIWNDRQLGGTPFLDGYEAVLLSLGTDYAAVNHHNLTSSDSRLSSFFTGPYWTFFQPTTQLLSEQALLGRAFSSSYTPKQGDPRREQMSAALKDLFQKTQTNNTVAMLYQTQVFIGRI